MTPIPRHRIAVNRSNLRLRRARRLYVFLCRHAIMEATDDQPMHRMILKMKNRGLYVIPDAIPWRSFRFSIVRYLYRIAGSPGEWGFWYRKNGFDNNFSREHLAYKTA